MQEQVMSAISKVPKICVHFDFSALMALIVTNQSTNQSINQSDTAQTSKEICLLLLTVHSDMTFCLLITNTVLTAHAFILTA